MQKRIYVLSINLIHIKRNCRHLTYSNFLNPVEIEAIKKPVKPDSC